MHNPYGDLSQPPRPVSPQWGQQPSQWGPEPPAAQSPSGQGYVSYGEGAAPPHPYQPAPGPFQPSELGALEDQAQLWLMVTVVGFWVSFGWLTGPLGWYFGSKIRRRYRVLGHHPCAAANWAWGLGIASTMFYLLVITACIGVLILFMNAPLVM